MQQEWPPLISRYTNTPSETSCVSQKVAAAISTVWLLRVNWTCCHLLYYELPLAGKKNLSLPLLMWKDTFTRRLFVDSHSLAKIHLVSPLRSHFTHLHVSHNTWMCHRKGSKVSVTSQNRKVLVRVNKPDFFHVHHKVFYVLFSVSTVCGAASEFSYRNALSVSFTIASRCLY